MKSNKLKSFIKEIQFVNRNPKDKSVLILLDERETNPEIVLDEGTHLYRSRIIRDRNQINKEEGFYGYGQKDSFVPPQEKTSDMRANYRYIPYFYCSNDKYTSVIEVRPRFSAEVSVATIMVQDKITLLDFTIQKAPKRRMTETKQNLFNDLSELFSKPIADSDDVLDYIPTQYIAEYAKNLGYDGIAFESSLYPEAMQKMLQEMSLPSVRINIVIFHYEKCTPIGSNVYKIIENYLECEQIDRDKNRNEIVSPVNEALTNIMG